MKKIVLFIFVSIMFYSCFPVKYAGKKSPKKYFQEFYIDQGVTQYFIKPLEYKNKKSEIKVDFTFRDSISDNGSVTINYSFFTEKLVKKIDSVFFVFPDKQIKLVENKKMFIENKNKLYEIRYSAVITFSQMNTIFEKDHFIVLFYNDTEISILPTKKTLFIYSIFNDKILNLIEINRE